MRGLTPDIDRCHRPTVGTAALWGKPSFHNAFLLFSALGLKPDEKPPTEAEMTDVMWQRARDTEAKPPVVGRLLGSLAASVYLLVAAEGAVVVGVMVLMTALSAYLIFATHNISANKIVRLHLSFGLVLEILISLAVPEAWHLMCIIAASTITAGVFGQRDRLSLLFGLLAALLLAAMGGIRGADYWISFSVALVLIGPIAASTAQILDVLRDQRSDALATLSSSVDAIIWEQQVETEQMIAVAGAAQSLTGYAPQEWGQLDHRQLVHSEDLEGFRSRGESGSWEGRISTASGEWRYVRESFREVVDEELGLVRRGISVDVNEIVAARNLASRHANYDQLTGMPNRHQLLTVAEQMLADSVSPTLFVVGIDKYKELTETLGYEKGDEFVRIIGRRISSLASSHGAMAARVVSDEFALLFRDALPSDMVQDLAREIQELCGQTVSIAGIGVRREISVGVATTDGNNADLVSLLRRGDTALEHARNTSTKWKLAEPEDLKQVEERFYLATQVEGALQEQHLQLWFQPKVDLSTRLISGFEGLVRWHHPERGVLSPWQFLDVIDVSGFADEFDRSMIAQAIEFGSVCRGDGHDLSISVNLPGRALLGDGTANYVREQLRHFGFPASRLVVELTEDEIKDDYHRITPNMNRLADLGCGLSIDDFGTGHSSLTRLYELPASEIKIDRSFVSKLDSDQSCQGIVRSTLHLAEIMGVTCVAEGVETDEIANLLLDYGCEVAQGFLFSRPTPRQDARELLTSKVPFETS